MQRRRSDTVREEELALATDAEFIGRIFSQRRRSDWVMTDGGKTTERTAAALTCHLSVMKERREKERKGGVTV